MSSRLDSAPLGATVHPTTGHFAWTPGENAGPGFYAPTIAASHGELSTTVTARVTVTATVSDGTLTATETLTVTVEGVNVPPFLGPIADQNVALAKRSALRLWPPTPTYRP